MQCVHWVCFENLRIQIEPLVIILNRGSICCHALEAFTSAYALHKACHNPTVAKTTAMQIFSLEEVGKHNSKIDLWVAIHGKGEHLIYCLSVISES